VYYCSSSGIVANLSPLGDGKLVKTVVDEVVSEISDSKWPAPRKVDVTKLEFYSKRRKENPWKEVDSVKSKWSES
jgi:hypothetical protein